MNCALLWLVVLFGSVSTGDPPVYRVLRKAITPDTPFEDLDQDLQQYLRNIFDAELEQRKLTDGVFSGFQRCRLMLTRDENILKYFLRMKSESLVKIPVEGGHAKIDMAHNWSLGLETSLVYLYNCLFDPDKHVKDAFTLS